MISVYANRRQLMARVHLAAGIALTLFIVVHLVEDCCYELSIAEALLAFIMMVTYWRIRSGASLLPIENTLMVSAVALFSSLLFFESIEDTGVFWVVGMPFVAYFVLQASVARYWVAFFAVEITIIALLESIHVIDTPYSAAQIFCLVAVVLFYWVLAHIYKSQLEHRQGLLEKSYQKLEEQQNRMQVLLDHSPIGIWMVDNQRHIQFLNKSWVEWSGITEEQAQQLDDYSTLLSDELAEASLLSDRTCLDGDGAYYFRENILCADGKKRTFDMIKVKLEDFHGNALGLVGFAIDISDKLHAEAEQQTLERQVQHSQRLESLGVMAGGIAHDFNNLLTAIQGNLDLAKLENNLSSSMKESLACIDTASQAATELCSQMLAYSGKGLFKPELFDINELVDDMRSLLAISIGKHVKLQLQQNSQATLIQGDRGQMNQVLLNLVINASEAIGQDRNGEIHILIDQEYFTGVNDHHFVGAELNAGPYIVLRVIDNGCGMDAETVDHMFDPFFSTKFAGRGLGMSATIGILRGHDAALQVESQPEKGTTMSIWLPQQAGAPIRHHKPQLSMVKTSGRVLVVDDEPEVLSVAQRMLERLGLTVETACNGRQAVDVYRNDSAFDWILLDVTMPEMDGVQCLEELRAINSELYVVMSSGYDSDSALAASRDAVPNDFLAKPYTIAALKAVVEKVTLLT